MNMIPKKYLALEMTLNSTSRAERLTAARQLGAAIAAGEISLPPATREVNNHVHTCYSFSPHTPSHAAWQAMRAGLQAVGIMDHDTVAGAAEMLEAGALLGIHTTAGFELRVSFAKTAMQGRILNGPGMPGIAYVAVHGIPASQLARCAAFLAPYQSARNRRNIAMLEKINAIFKKHHLCKLNFTRDVYAHSCAAEGGSITERHLLAALVRQIISELGTGKRLIQFIENKLHIALSATTRQRLSTPDMQHYLYDLLGVLKAEFSDSFFIMPDETETPPVDVLLKFSEEIGAISAYAYLGDVGESPTGDKKAEEFEDSFLDDLLPLLKSLGFRAITYMPPRNTKEQLARISNLCQQHGFMQISGVDINSSRQSFSCPEINDPRFSNLLEATWALIGHEKIAYSLPECGLFSTAICQKHPQLDERIALFANIGRALNARKPYLLPNEAAPLQKICTDK